MPFPLIPTALGICFLLVWTIIGGMVFRDGQLALRSEHDANLNILPLDAGARERGNRVGGQRTRRNGQTSVRAAS